MPTPAWIHHLTPDERCQLLEDIARADAHWTRAAAVLAVVSAYKRRAEQRAAQEVAA